MRLAVCDDDVGFTEQMKRWLTEYFVKQKLDMPEIVIYHNGEALLNDENAPDIAFLDVEMAGISGIYTGRNLLYRNPEMLIFIITSYPDYLDEALRFNAFRYLTKPLEKTRLYRNLKDALKIYTTSNIKIAIETPEETIIVRAPEIICLESMGHKLYVHTTRGDYMSVKKMDYWESHLNMHCFFRTHRSFIVNLEHVSRYDRSLVYLDDGSSAYLTKRKYPDFRKAFMLYLEGAKV